MPPVGEIGRDDQLPGAAGLHRLEALEPTLSFADELAYGASDIAADVASRLCMSKALSYGETLTEVHFEQIVECIAQVGSKRALKRARTGAQSVNEQPAVAIFIVYSLRGYDSKFAKVEFG